MVPLSGSSSHSPSEFVSSYEEIHGLSGDVTHSAIEKVDFVNISITPVECSVVCSTEATSKLFTPIIEQLRSSDVVIGVDEFVVLQVDGEGQDAGRRVLDLTSPLAFAGMYVPSV